MKSTVTLKQGMHFMGELGGFDLPLDADEKFGGQNKGVKPKDMILTSLAGCTAMDVISILRKMRIEIKSFSVEASGEYTEEHPKVFKNIHLIYRVKGENVRMDKVERAVELSKTQYCGVSAMLNPTVPMTHEIKME